ncbi:MAG: hypothetical protein NWQ09_08945 [Nonlabens sp.]|nr:hypothetical protein [Nonlabens sp.]
MKFLFTILFLSAAIGLNAQKPLDGLQEQFTHYTQLVKDGEFDKALDYSPEKIFTIVPRSALIKAMESTMNDPEMEFAFFLPAYVSFEMPFEDQGIKYQVFYYKQRMTLKFIAEPEDGETQEIVDFSNNLRLELFKDVYGEDNVSFNAETQIYDVNVEKKALAIHEESAAHLHFAVLEEDKKELMKRIFSNKVINKIY